MCTANDVGYYGGARVGLQGARNDLNLRHHPNVGGAGGGGGGLQRDGTAGTAR